MREGLVFMQGGRVIGADGLRETLPVSAALGDKRLFRWRVCLW